MKLKFFSLLLALFVLLGVFAGCGSSQSETTDDARQTAEDSGSENSSPESVTLRVAYMPNYGSLWSIVNAEAQGYLEEEGIDVELVEFADGPTIIAAMESGSIDVGYIGQGAHKLCVEGQAKIFAFSHISNGDAVIGGPDVKTIADLKGKKVAYSSGTSSEDILLKTLALEGLTLDDIEAYDMDATALVTAILSGSVDAAATWSPSSLTILDELEGSTLLSNNLTFADTTVSLASWVAAPEYAENNYDILVRFTRALFKAMDYAADDHYEETAQLIAEQVAQDVDSVYQQRGDAEWFTGKEVVDGIADGTIKGYYELQKQNFIDAGTVDVDPDVSEYVMFDLMTEAGNY